MTYINRLKKSCIFDFLFNINIIKIRYFFYSKVRFAKIILNGNYGNKAISEI